MPKNNRPEFTWVKEKQLYKKQIRNPQTGKWLAIYGKTKAELRERLREKEAEFAEMETRSRRMCLSTLRSGTS